MSISHELNIELQHPILGNHRAMLHGTGEQYS